MTSLELTLNYCCQECEEAVEIKVTCEGKGLAAGPRVVAGVNVPCPFCGETSQVCFHPTGQVVAVRPTMNWHRRCAFSPN
jgi:hypothetical protein